MAKPRDIPGQVALLAAHEVYKGLLSACKEALAELRAECKRLGLSQEATNKIIAQAEPK